MATLHVRVREAQLAWMLDARAIIEGFVSRPNYYSRSYIFHDPDTMNIFDGQITSFGRVFDFGVRALRVFATKIESSAINLSHQRRVSKGSWQENDQLRVCDDDLRGLAAALERMHELVVGWKIATGQNGPLTDRQAQRLLRFDSEIAHTNTRLYELGRLPIGHNVPWETNCVVAPVSIPPHRDRRNEGTHVWADIDYFRASLAKRCPGLAVFDWHKHQFALAGLSVMECMLYGDAVDRVLDAVHVYPIKTTLAEFEAGVDALAATIAGDEIERTESKITIKIGNLDIVVHAKVSNDIAELLHSFDLGSHAVAYDGKALYASQLGRDTALRHSVVVEPMSIYPGFEHRLGIAQQYFIVSMPGLDVSSLLINRRSKCGAAVVFGPPVVRDTWIHCALIGTPDPENQAEIRDGTMAVAKYVPGMRISSIQPDYRKLFAARYSLCVVPLCIDKLRELVGPDRAKRIVSTIIDTGSHPDTDTVYDDKLDGELRRIPFALKSIVRPRAPNPNWYGDADMPVPGRFKVEPYHTLLAGLPERMAKIVEFYASRPAWP